VDSSTSNANFHDSAQHPSAENIRAGVISRRMRTMTPDPNGASEMRSGISAESVQRALENNIDGASENPELIAESKA
jgi:hypothetical protein